MPSRHSPVAFLADATPLDPPGAHIMTVVNGAGWVLIAIGLLTLILGGAQLVLGLSTGDRHPRGVILAISGVGGMLVGAVLPMVVKSLLPTSDSSAVTATTTPPAPSPTPASTPAPAPASTGHHLDTGLIGTWVPIIVAVLIVVGLFGVGLPKAREAWSRRRTRVDAVRAQWAKASALLAEVDDEYAAFHADLADRIFLRPLLDDTNEPLTAAFLDAYTEAHAAAFESQPISEDLAATALRTAQAARAAWTKADAHARRVGLGGDPAQRGKLTIARKLLNQALDPGITDAHRTNLLDRITALIAEAGATTTPPIHTLVTDAVQHRLGHLARRQLERIRETTEGTERDGDAA